MRVRSRRPWHWVQRFLERVRLQVLRWPPSLSGPARDELPEDALGRFPRRFGQVFGIPVPPGLGLPLDRLRPLGSSLLWGTPGCEPWLDLLLGEPSPEGPDAPIPEGTAFLGFWGHGVNSHAFYLFLRRPDRYLHLRLPYGGVYRDNEEAAATIGAYLTALGAFLESAGQDNTLVVACEGMSGGTYRCQWPGTDAVEHAGSLLPVADFMVLKPPGTAPR